MLRRTWHHSCYSFFVLRPRVQTRRQVRVNIADPDFPPVPSGNFQGSTSNYKRIASHNVLPNSLFSKHPAMKHYHLSYWQFQTSPRLQIFSDIIKRQWNKVNYNHSLCLSMHRNKPTPFREMLQFSDNRSIQNFSSPEWTLPWKLGSPLKMEYLSLPPEPATHTYFCLPSIQVSRKP